MKHLFVINPSAGGKNHVNDIESKLNSLNTSAEIYVTQCNGDATRYVESFCSLNAGENLRIYACGGDGTLNEVVTGVLNGFSIRLKAMSNVANNAQLLNEEQKRESLINNVEVGCLPCGSGNDYIKYWSDIDFHDIKTLMEAPSVEVDVMKVCYRQLKAAHQTETTDKMPTYQVRYAINTLNYGFEAEVCRVMDEVRRKPIIGGRMAYVTGIVKSLANGRHNPCHISIDGKPWKDGDLMLASFANGRYEGGGFLSAPRSLNDDGLIEVTAITPISVLRFAKMIGYYKSGEHLDRPELQDIIHYCRAQNVVIESDRQFCIGIDGELLYGYLFKVENLRHAIRFITPVALRIAGV